uniref:Uncharacterized protein n=1 Tax=Rhizophora mucronata TaxID=61149 RepID=A0A2P2N2F5_RHIMU
MGWMWRILNDFIFVL